MYRAVFFRKEIAKDSDKFTMRFAFFLGLFFLYVPGVFALNYQSQGIASLCSQKCTKQSSSIATTLQATCEAERKTLGCDELQKKNPADDGLFARCDLSSLCKQDQDFQNEKAKACWRGYKNAVIDSAKMVKDVAVSLADFTERTWVDFKTNNAKRDEFLKQCDLDLTCKKDLIKDFPRFHDLPDATLSKYSAAYLYVQAENNQNFKNEYDRIKNIGKIPSDAEILELTPQQKDKLQDLMAIASNSIQEKYHQYACYSGIAQVEMSCYILGNVVDPTVLAGVAFKGVRVIGAVVKLARGAEAAEEAEVIARAAKVSARAADVVDADVDTTKVTLSRSGLRALNREKLIKDYLHFSPTTVEQNEKWMDVAYQGVNKDIRFVDVENSELKSLNDSLKDKNLATSLTNLHKDILFQKIEALKKEFPDMNILEYSDYKSSRFAISGKIPPNLKERLDKIFKDANNEFDTYLKDQKIVRDTDKSEDWFHAGGGLSADRANRQAGSAAEKSAKDLKFYEDTDLAATDANKMKTIETQRVTLRNDLAGTSVIDGSTLNKDAFDIVRKNIDDPEKTSQLLSQRFALSNLPQKTVSDLQDYVRSSSDFSPGNYIPKREVASLKEATHGGFSVDIIGLGAANYKATAEALARSKNSDDALIEARKGWKDVTAEFHGQKDYFQKAVERSVDPGKLKTICSGDDCVAVAVKPLSETEKNKILSALADSKYSGQYRLAFVSDGVKDAGVRDLLATEGESMEKVMRSSLSAVMEPRKLQGLTFGLDMRTQELHNGSIKLLMGEAPGVSLTTQDRALIQRKFEESLQDFNLDQQKKGISSSYAPEK